MLTTTTKFAKGDLVCFRTRKGSIEPSQSNPTYVIALVISQDIVCLGGLTNPITTKDLIYIGADY